MENMTNTDFACRDKEFKDESPLKTVEKIKDILRENNIETVESWLEPSVPYCYSLRVSVVGTTFGTNGKGITEEFALASAYGELMERLQLGYIGSDNIQKDGSFSVNDAQSVTVPAKELLDRNYKWYEALSKSLERFTSLKEAPEDILMRYADAEGNVFATPYYCITSDSKEYFPTVLRKAVYTANGCAAGNTPEEAIVQALSEIVERNHQVYMFYNNVTAPEVPEEVIEKCDIAHKIILFLRQHGFKVVVKDCSLSTKFPVVSVCIINSKTGRYHTHLGAYPVFEIALQRALTESFQGRHITKLANYADFRYDDPKGLNINVLLNGLVRGVSEKFPQFFVGENNFPYNADMGFRGRNNKELLQECIEFFKKKGCDILVRDCSCLGFPTYQVLIPGYSETFAHRLSLERDDLRYHHYARKVLRNPAKADMEEMLGLLMYLAESSKISKGITKRGNFASATALSLDYTPQEDVYIMQASQACVNYALMRYSDAVKCIDKMLQYSDVEDEGYLICIKRYLSFIINGYGDAEAKELLQFFHDKSTVDRLYSCIELGKNPLEEFTLHCEGECNENCILFKSCRQQRVREIARLIKSKTSQLEFDACVQKLKQCLK